MNRPRKTEHPPARLVSAAKHRSLCALFVLWMCMPVLSADDFELVNPAAKEFGEIKPDTKRTGNFAKKSPALNDRILPKPEKPKPIRQVSTNENDGNDPFPKIDQPMMPQTPAIDWGAVAPDVQNYVPNYPPPYYAPPIQNYAQPYDFGYAQPNAVMQNMNPMGMEPEYFQQFAQYPQQQYYQGYMMDSMNNSHAGMYAQYGQTAAPYYGMNEQMGTPMNYQGIPDYQAMYQVALLQEMARQRAGTPVKPGGDKEKEAEEAKKQAESNWTLNNLVPVRITSPLGETMLACAKTVSPFSTPTGPDKGAGMPLVNKSWLDHPYYFGGFVGTIYGSELVSKMIDQKHGGNGGFTFGYNFNDYWGLESRVHFAAIDIQDTEYARNLVEGMLTPGSGIIPLWTTRTNELTILDAAVHYYPLGNAKWRPYCKYGLGVGHAKFVDSFGFEQSADIITMPLGLGMRYWWNERIAIQADLTDNMIFASGNMKTQNNIAFTIGLTFAFGSGKREHPVHYWPATPSMGSQW